MEEKIIRPFYHTHPLMLKENVSKEDCYGCGDPIPDLEIAYVCMEHDCSIVLHNKCGELPNQIHHPKHPDHPTHLTDFHLLGNHWCDVCRRGLDKVLGYRCFSCDFDVDVGCRKIGIDALLEEKKELQHPYHDHPLILMRKPAFSFHCDGCDAQDVDMAYICITCDIMLHKSCASLPAVLPRDHPHNHHHHRLFLAFSFPDEHRKFEYTCEVCDKVFGRVYWVYFCGDCRYFVHLKCVGSTTKPRSNSIEDDGSDVIEFPLHPNEISDKLITPFVMREKGVDNIPFPTTTSNSFSFKFHEHPLHLVSKLSDEDDQEYQEEEDVVESKICDVCVTPISSPPYYDCFVSACNYSIHSICFLLPNTLHLSSPNSYRNCQNHNFTLFAPSKSKAKDAISYWYCDLCYLDTNGMGYECEECEMKIDVKCASVPTAITHATHLHRRPLLLKPSAQRNPCRGCSYSRYGVAYGCSDDECDFALHFKCAMLPKSMREKEWDKHPLLLTFDASRDHPSDFFCEFCEEEMHPKRWMYHCRQCDASFHCDCLKDASGEYRNIKFGRRLELDGLHPTHPLTFAYITLKRDCDVCHENVYADLGLECALCYYVVCWGCAFEELEKI